MTAETDNERLDRLERHVESLDSGCEVVDYLLGMALEIIGVRARLAREVAAGDEPPSDEIMLWEARVAQAEARAISDYVLRIGTDGGGKTAEALARWEEVIKGRLLPKRF